MVTLLEDGLVVEGPQKNPGPLNIACRHLEEYLETRVRVKQKKAQAEKT
jgi:hypothetical protein